MPSFAAALSDSEAKAFPCLYPRRAQQIAVDISVEDEPAFTSPPSSELQILDSKEPKHKVFSQNPIHIEDLSIARQQQSDESILGSTNTYGTTTPRDCAAALVAMSLNTAFVLVGLGKVESTLTSSTLWIRGAIMGGYILYPCSFSATIESTVLRSPPRASTAIMSALAFFSMLVLMSAIPVGDDSGFGYVVMAISGGLFMHVPVLSMCVANGANVKAIALVLASSSLLFNIIIFNGIGACIWYPLLAQEQPVVSGLLFSVALGGAEQIAVKCLGLMLNRMFSDVLGRCFIASNFLLHYHSYMESFRLTAMIYGVIDESSGTSWVYAIGFSFIINLSIRSSWSTYALYKVVGLEAFLRPNCITVLHHQCRYSCGYFRFAGILGLILARAVLLGFDRIGEWWFNSTVLAVLVCCLAAEILEDLAAFFLESNHWEAPWPHCSRHFYESCIQGDLRKLYDYSSGFPKIAYDREKFHVVVVLFAGTCSAMFAILGLIPLVSLQFLLGQCDTAELSILKGGTVLWNRADGC